MSNKTNNQGSVAVSINYLVASMLILLGAAKFLSFLFSGSSNTLYICQGIVQVAIGVLLAMRVKIGRYCILLYSILPFLLFYNIFFASFRILVLWLYRFGFPLFYLWFYNLNEVKDIFE
ncbi:MAG: hypothetical protein KAS04_01390 [Candidatus Aenigmarchaeota archaeon]|nr:hypothetical protein [Candidatus Aenigmarchaeota archaeon]